MKFLRARITKFRSIDDSGWFTLEDVTSLVGKNESGKTTALNAIYKLSPLNSSSEEGNFVPLTDYPRKGYSKYKKIHDKSPADVISGEFELVEAEIKSIESKYGKDVLKSHKVTATKNYKNVRSWSVDVDEKSAIKHLLHDKNVTSEIKEILKKSDTIESVKELFSSLETEDEQSNTFISEFNEKFEDTLSKNIINNFLKVYIPRFVYFDDYSIMQGKVAVNDLIRRKDNDADNLSPSDQTVLSLMSLADGDLEDFANADDFEELKANLEAVSSSITQEVFEFWRQNRELRVTFDLSPANPKDVAPYNSGSILHIRVWNNRHQMSVPFDNRSRGFVWFFSFLAFFSQIEDEGHDLILLLDEPALNLHAKAQKDFLRFIDERLLPDHQVIYTTHSPFMIDPQRLERARTVQDIDGQGTVIHRDTLKNDSDTVFPLQAALGYELTQSLFVGPNCLLVEGPSELVYIPLLSTLTESAGMSFIDPRWVIVPVGGADKVSTFVTLLGSNGLNIAVLIDASKRDQQRISNLHENSLLKSSSLIQVSEITGNKNSDFEDIFEEDFYLELVNGAYASKLSKPLTVDMLSDKNPRIMKRIETYFKENNVNGGKFNHYLPAQFLINSQKTHLKKINKKTLKRVSMLFDRVNNLIGNKVESKLIPSSIVGQTHIHGEASNTEARV